MKIKNNKRYFLFCEPCCYKRIFEANEQPDLIEVKTSNVPAGIPQLDPVTQKTVLKKEIPQKKKYKCPQCGRSIVVKELPEAYAKSFKDVDERNRKAQEEADKKKRIQDGQPQKRIDIDTEFTG